MDVMLSDTVKDTITGFTGTVTAKIEYLHGTTLFTVTSKMLDNGKIINESFEEGRLEITHNNSDDDV